MKRTILTALAAVSLFGCGSSGDGSGPVATSNPTVTQQAPQSSTQPPANPDQPANGGEQPALNPDQPPANPNQLPGTGVTRGGSATPSFSCSTLCGAVDPACSADCTKWCNWIDPSVTMCVAEAAAVRACAPNAHLRCENGQVTPAGDTCANEGQALYLCRNPQVTQAVPGNGTGG